MESLDYLRFVLALIFVLGLIGLTAWLARRFRLGGMPLASGGARRLHVVEATALDPRRKLILVRRDEVEHLLLIGQDGNRVVESGIQAASPAPEQGGDDQ